MYCADDNILNFNSIGEAEELQSQSIFLILRVLLQIAQVRQGVDQAKGSALIQGQGLGDILDAQIGSPAVLEQLKDGKRALDRLDILCCSHVALTFVLHCRIYIDTHYNLMEFFCQHVKKITYIFYITDRHSILTNAKQRHIIISEQRTAM